MPAETPNSTQLPGGGLARFWYIAARSAELRRKPLRTRIFAQDIVLFRGGDGAPAALLDRCAHRNIALSQGKVDRGCIECPYHGWRYDQGGTCRGIPALGDAPPPASARVRAFPALEQDGFIWLYMGDGPPSGDPFSFPNINTRGWVTFVMKTRFQAGVEACLENFLDCPHTVYVHRGWFRTPDTRSLTARVTRDSHGACADFEDEPISPSLISKLLFPKGRQLRHSDRFVIPNISRVDYDFGPDRHFIITSQCTPVGDRETEVYTAMTYTFGKIGPLVRLVFEPLSRRIIHQDVTILREMTRTIESFGGEAFSHAETDLLGLHIQSLRRRLSRGDSIPDDDVSEKSIEIRF
ncbi:Rieske 2Fe-2S domain-containing protein [soil metagenome]